MRVCVAPASVSVPPVVAELEALVPARRGVAHDEVVQERVEEDAEAYSDWMLVGSRGMWCAGARRWVLQAVWGSGGCVDDGAEYEDCGHVVRGEDRGSGQRTEAQDRGTGQRTEE